MSLPAEFIVLLFKILIGGYFLYPAIVLHAMAMDWLDRRR